MARKRIVDGAINILTKPKKKDDFVNLANELKLTPTGTVAELKGKAESLLFNPQIQIRSE